VYLRAWPPCCFYCGLRATTLDRSKPRALLGASRIRSLKSACARCNARKGSGTASAFRARLVKIAKFITPSSKRTTIRFYGEGARKHSLARLRKILDTYRRNGKLVSHDVAADIDMAKKARRPPPVRWSGRFTFEGSNALRALAKATGCSIPAIERFIADAKVRAGNKERLVRACKKLGLNVASLRRLKPPR
jgi:hypothetical protein